MAGLLVAANTVRSLFTMGIYLAVLPFAGLPHADAQEELPRVVVTVPADGQSGVDPGLEYIRIEFDQAMDQDIGWSVCGGGPSFPVFVGQPQWPDPQTFIWKVQLEPEHEYVISVNCPKSGRWFRSKAGVPVARSLVRFKTGGGGDPRLGAEQNRAAITELRHLIDTSYSYQDLHGIDWDKLFEDSRIKLEQARSAHEFAKAAGRMLAEAKDVHIWLTVGDTMYGSYRRQAAPNFSYYLLAESVPGWTEPDQCVATGRFEDGVGYVLIKSWSPECAPSLERAYAMLRETGRGGKLVIDVRPNSGGDENLARDFAGCFVEAPAVYSRNLNRTGPGPDGFAGPFDRMLLPNANRPSFRGKVAVLMGPINMSSCESFLLMMKQVPGCKLVGHKSYGSSGNPKPHNLSNGVTVHLPSWKDLLPDGTLLEGNGVVPDIDVSKATHPFTMKDPVLECGLIYLRE